MRDVEMILHCVSSLVGKPPCMVQSLGIKDVAVADSVSQGYPTIGSRDMCGPNSLNACVQGSQFCSV